MKIHHYGRAPERRDAPETRRTRSFAFEFRAVDEQSGDIEGYGSVFGVVDDYGDIVAPGAFEQSLAAHRTAGTMPAMLWQHDPGEPIGTWTEMAEDARGLRVKGRIVTETERGRAAIALLKAGALRGLSIGFFTEHASFDEQSRVRTVTQIDLWEVSLVTFAANKLAFVDSVKSIDMIASPSDAEAFLREAGPLSKSQATALVSRLLRMGEERREAAQSALALKASADRLLAKLKP